MARDPTNPDSGWYVVEGEAGAHTLRHWQRFDTQDACVRFMVRNGWTSDNGHQAMFWSEGKWKAQA